MEFRFAVKVSSLLKRRSENSYRERLGSLSCWVAQEWRAVAKSSEVVMPILLRPWYRS